LRFEGEVAIESGMHEQELRVFDAPRQVAHELQLFLGDGFAECVQISVRCAPRAEGGFGVVVRHPAAGEVNIGGCREHSERTHHGEFVVAAEPCDAIVLRRQVTVDADHPGRIRSPVDEVADEHHPAMVNIGQSCELTDDLPQLLCLAVHVANYGNWAIDALGDGGHVCEFRSGEVACFRRDFVPSPRCPSE